MSNNLVGEILTRLHSTQAELNRELDRLLEQGREQFRYRLERGRVVFELSVRRLHLRHRVSVWRYLLRARIAFIASAPFIYGLIVPLALLDLSVTLYQQVCFRIYGIPCVRRRDYLVIDRHRLAYLNGIEKLNCVYCGYANQLIEYVREVAGRTEQFWCPIKHTQRTRDPHTRTRCFVDYGDAESYRSRLNQLRRQWDPRGESGDRGAEGDPGP